MSLLMREGMAAMRVVKMADGSVVPAVAVKALDTLEERWPGATLLQARPAVVAAVLDALFPVRVMDIDDE